MAMKPEIEEALKLWRVGGKIPLNVYEGDKPMFQCHTPEDAERIVRLLNGERSEPVAPTYEEARDAACEGCREHWSVSVLDGDLVHVVESNGAFDGLGTSTPGKIRLRTKCTAPTPEEYMAQLARRVQLAETQLDSATSTYIDNHARLEQAVEAQAAEAARLRGVLEQIKILAVGFCRGGATLRSVEPIEELAERALAPQGEAK